MNIFFLDEDPVVAATYMHDKHVVKMILETAQILSTVLQARGIRDPLLYKPTHPNHPSVLWAGADDCNYRWLCTHGIALCDEYIYRYGRLHKSAAVIDLAMSYCDGSDWRNHTPPAQAMPDEFRHADPVTAYRNYYLGRKVEQSKWTRRPVPDFVISGVNMAKKEKTSAKAEATAAVAKAAESAKNAVIGVRGPRGVDLEAAISIMVATNPKRPSSASYARFDLYKEGMTVREALDAGVWTADLIYDAAHNFIKIEGYTSPKPFVAKERAPKADKPAKTPKAKKEKPAEAVAAESELQSATAEETID